MDLEANNFTTPDLWVSCLGSFPYKYPKIINQESQATCLGLLCPHLECVALADTRMGLFNDPFPTQQVGRESLCQVAKLFYIDTVCDLIDSDQYSNVSSTD